MSRRTIGYTVTAVGVIVVLVAALADPLGIGGSDAFGWKQIVGVVVGAVVAVAGLVIAMRGAGPAPAPGIER